MHLESAIVVMPCLRFSILKHMSFQNVHNRCREHAVDTLSTTLQENKVNKGSGRLQAHVDSCMAMMMSEDEHTPVSAKTHLLSDGYSETRDTHTKVKRNKLAAKAKSKTHAKMMELNQASNVTRTQALSEEAYA